MPESAFEIRMERGLREMADDGLRPFDARALAEAAVASRRGWRVLVGSGARPRLVLVAAALLLASSLAIAALLGQRQPAPLRPLPAVTTEQLAFVRDGDLWVADANGRNARLLVARDRQEIGSRGLQAVQWSADGSRLMTVVDSDPFRRLVPPRVEILASDGTLIGAFDVTASPGEMPLLAWSPDGKQLAVLDVEPPDGGLLLYDETGRLVRAIDLPPAYRAALPVAYPAISWSPDGRFLAVTGCPCDAENNGGWIVPVDGSAARQVPFPGDGNASTLAWSPDGARLAVGSSHWAGSFTTPPDGPGEVWVMDLDGRNAKRLTVSELPLVVIGFSNDGAWIAYGAPTTTGVAAGPPALDVIRADGQGESVRMGILKGPMVWSFEQDRPFFMPWPTGVHTTDGTGASILAGDPAGGPPVPVIEAIDYGPFDVVWPGH